MRDRYRFSWQPKPPPMPLGFKIWMAFCGVLGLTILGVVLWAVIRVVNHYT